MRPRCEHWGQRRKDAQTYRFSIGYARSLYALAKAAPYNTVVTRDQVKMSNQMYSYWTKPSLWELIYQGGMRGQWGVSDAGWAFLHGRIKIPSEVVVWDGMKKFTGDWMSISEATKIDNWQYEDYVQHRIPKEVFMTVDDIQGSLFPLEFREIDYDV